MQKKQQFPVFFAIIKQGFHPQIVIHDCMVVIFIIAIIALAYTVSSSLVEVKISNYLPQEFPNHCVIPVLIVIDY